MPKSWDLEADRTMLLFCVIASSPTMDTFTQVADQLGDVQPKAVRCAIEYLCYALPLQNARFLLYYYSYVLVVNSADIKVARDSTSSRQRQPPFRLEALHQPLPRRAKLRHVEPRRHQAQEREVSGSARRTLVKVLQNVTRRAISRRSPSLGKPKEDQSRLVTPMKVQSRRSPSQSRTKGNLLRLRAPRKASKISWRMSPWSTQRSRFEMSSQTGTQRDM